MKFSATAAATAALATVATSGKLQQVAAVAMNPHNRHTAKWTNAQLDRHTLWLTARDNVASATATATAASATAANISWHAENTF